MSTSLPRAVSIRMGVASLARIARATSRPVTLGEHQVEYHEVRLVRVDHGDGLGSVDGLADLVALSFEVRRHETAQILIVLDNQNPQGIVHGLPIIAHVERGLS